MTTNLLVPSNQYLEKQAQSQLNISTKPKKRKSKQNGHNSWSLEENMIYAKCLLELSQHFESQFVRRSRRVFRTISAQLPQRTPEQCRSHHQKMMKSYKSFNGIYEHFLKLSMEKGITIPQSILDCDQIQEESSEKDNQFGEVHLMSASSEEKNDQSNQAEEYAQQKTWDDVFSF